MDKIYQFLISVFCLSTSNVPHTDNDPDQNAIMDCSNSSTSDMAGHKVNRGGNYTSDEYVSIARAYLYVTTDAIVRLDQKGTHNYLRIYEAYKERNPNSVPWTSTASVSTG